jgi:TRAP-type mannitol/chloroaromatic compound transport system permease small subunit
LNALLKVSSWIDGLAELIGKLIMGLVLACVLISAGNAVVRKAFSIGSNAFLEIQWYLFAAVFMLGAGYVFLKNGHVRIDFIASRLSLRANAIIDVLGIVLLMLPFCWLMIDLSWPLFMRAYVSGEMSQNAGGLIRWPVLALIPAGFALLGLQSLSELVKRIAFLTGHRSEPYSVEAHEKLLEIKLAEELLAEAESRNQAAAAVVAQPAAPGTDATGATGGTEREPGAPR